MWKSQFSLFWSNAQIFLENFQSFLHFWSKRAGFLISLLDGNPSNFDDLAFLYQFQSIFSKNFKNFHPISIVLLYLSHFLSFFDKFLNKLIEFIGNLSGFIRSPEKYNFLNKFPKKLRNSCKICSIFEIFLRKKWIFLAINFFDIFEKWIHFLKLRIVLKF